MACLLKRGCTVYYNVIFIHITIPFLKFYSVFVAEILQTARTASNISVFKGLSKKLISRTLECKDGHFYLHETYLSKANGRRFQFFRIFRNILIEFIRNNE